MSPVIRTLIFTIFIPGFWTAMMPYWILPRGARPDWRGAGAAGWLLVAAGIALYFACAFWGFAVRGKGTPLPADPPKKLVVEGPYRVVRNPMYWSVALVVLGEAAVFHSVALVDLAAVFFVGVNLFVLFFEEPGLRQKFGAEYEEYCRRTPRWLPGMPMRLSRRGPR
jgi:protein-S-isoprenylcysteine O-methyltransferase Ste14